MKLPEIAQLMQSKEHTEEFKGLDHNLRTQTGEWFDDINMTTDFYPVASPRGKRSIQYKTEKTQIGNTDYYLDPLPLGMTYNNSTLIMLRNIVDEKGNVKGAWFTTDNKLYMAEDYEHNIIKKASSVSCITEGYSALSSTAQKTTIPLNKEWKDLIINIVKPNGQIITITSLFKNYGFSDGLNIYRFYYDCQTKVFSKHNYDATVGADNMALHIKGGSRLEDVCKEIKQNIVDNNVVLTVTLVNTEDAEPYNTDAFAFYIVKTGLEVKPEKNLTNIKSTIIFKDDIHYLENVNITEKNNIVFSFLSGDRKISTIGNQVEKIEPNKITVLDVLDDDIFNSEKENVYALTFCDETAYSTTVESAKVFNEIVDEKMGWFMENNDNTDKVNGYKRSVVRNASYISIFPDGVVYETKNETDIVPVKKINIINKNTSLNRVYGKRTLAGLRTVVENSNDNLGYSAISFGEKVHRLIDDKVQVYNKNSAMWIDIPSYVMLAYLADVDEDPLFKDINEGDIINISIDLTNESNEDAAYGFNTIEGMAYMDGDKLKFLENLKVIKKGDGRIEGEGFRSKDGTTISAVAAPYIILSGKKNYVAINKDDNGNASGMVNLFGTSSPGGTITIERKMPDICLACENGNRIWGCTKDGHEIYASALGNPYVYYDYSGLSTDSYAVTVGTDGEWTGCINYCGLPYFFKETSMTVISGRYPEEYSVLTYTDFMGVEKGSENSLAVINGILYYKSRLGVVAFDGSSTVIISSKLGREHYKNAVAGALGNKYYISMENDFGERSLFVYDTSNGMWIKEDDIVPLQYLNVNNHLLFSTKQAVMNTTAENALEAKEYEFEEEFEWMAETGTYGYSYPNNKYLTRFQIRIGLETGSRAEFYIEYNSSGNWISCGEMYGKGIRSYLFAVRPCRCDHMKLRIKGSGKAKIYSISKLFEEGGDVNA